MHGEKSHTTSNYDENQKGNILKPMYFTVLHVRFQLTETRRVLSHLIVSFSDPFSIPCPHELPTVTTESHPVAWDTRTMRSLSTCSALSPAIAPCCSGSRHSSSFSRSLLCYFPPQGLGTQLPLSPSSPGSLFMLQLKPHFLKEARPDFHRVPRRSSLQHLHLVWLFMLAFPTKL